MDRTISLDLDSLDLKSNENSCRNLEVVFDHTKKFMTIKEIESFYNRDNADQIKCIENKSGDNDKNIKKIKKEHYGVIDTSKRPIELVYTKNIIKIKNFLPSNANVSHEAYTSFLKMKLFVDTSNSDTLDQMYCHFADKRTTSGKFGRLLDSL